MKKIKTIAANEQVFEYIKEAIINEEWKSGEKIPSENTLAENFGVNRLTVRMALKKLVALGILETRTGDGTYVKGFHFEDYIHQITDFYMTPDLLQCVYDFRKTMEIECARLAILHASDDEVEELCRINNDFQNFKREYKKSSDEYFDKFVEKDFAFHKQLVTMAHNDLFLYSYEVAQEPIRKYMHILVRDRIASWNKKGISSSEWNDKHSEICEAIRNKDFASCEQAMLKMVDFKVDLSTVL